MTSLGKAGAACAKQNAEDREPIRITIKTQPNHRTNRKNVDYDFQSISQFETGLLRNIRTNFIEHLRQKELKLTMLIWRKRASVDVDVGINLNTCYTNSAAFQNSTKGTGDNAFTDSANDTTRYKNILHGTVFSQDVLTCTILILYIYKVWRTLRRKEEQREEETSPFLFRFGAKYPLPPPPSSFPGERQ